MEAKAGCNREKDSKHECSVNEYSFLFEQRMFELKIANFREYMERGITFTADFTFEVEGLPAKYDKNDSDNRDKFERFFNKFGHFMVTSAYGGGAIEAKIADSEKLSFAEVKASLSASFDGGLWRAFGGTSGSDSRSTSKKSSAILSRSSLNWYGGNRDLQRKVTVENQEQMLKWRASLLVNPAILTTEMCLEPISTAVSCVDRNKDQASYDALKDLLGGEFKVLARKEKEREEEKQKEEAKTREAAIQQPTSDGACFPSSSMVHVEDIDGSFVRKKIIDVSVGDKVIAWDVKRNRSVSSKVVMFAHWEPAAIDVEYVKIVLQDSTSIVLSSNHLVMMGEHLQATMAQNVQPGHILYTINEKGSLSPQQVLAVQTIIDTGMFCPITTEGNLVVDNVLASCYASVNDQVFLNGLIKLPAQKIAHLGLLPMRFLNKLNVKWIAKLPKDECIHPYVKWLCKLKLPCMDTALELN